MGVRAAAEASGEPSQGFPGAFLSLSQSLPGPSRGLPPTSGKPSRSLWEASRKLPGSLGRPLGKPAGSPQEASEWQGSGARSAFERAEHSCTFSFQALHSQDSRGQQVLFRKLNGVLVTEIRPAGPHVHCKEQEVLSSWTKIQSKNIT